jgi:SNF2 family DNA or RNA helicase
MSAEAAGEGRNLQLCRRVINYELPWDPMRMEQRVGRIRRIGQTRAVDIFSECAEVTVEDHILRISHSKISIFEFHIGETDMSPWNLGRGRDFDDIAMDVWT